MLLWLTKAVGLLTSKAVGLLTGNRGDGDVTAGGPMHNRARMVVTPITLERLRLLHEAIGALLAWSAVPADAGRLRLLILPDGNQRVMVLPSSVEQQGARAAAGCRLLILPDTSCDTAQAPSGGLGSRQTIPNPFIY
jgi:hypothetical protein